MKKFSAVAAVSMFFAFPVLADDSGFYIGGNVGVASTDVGGASLSKSSDTSIGLIGGYQFTKYFAVEGQYNDMGKIGYGNNYSLKADSLSAIGIFPIPDTRFSLRGKLGYARTSIDAPNTSGENGVVVGIGGQYMITKAIGLNVGLDRYDVGNSSVIPGGYTTQFYTGVSYKF